MNDKRRGNRFSRRGALAALAAAPAAALLSTLPEAAEKEAAPAPAPPKPSPYARFIAKDSKDLSGAERAQLLRQAPGLESALTRLRDMPLADDIEPAFAFRPLRSRREGRG